MALTVEQLEKGKTYRFEYVSLSGNRCWMFGKYVGTSTHYEQVWYCFTTAGGNFFYDREALNNFILLD